MPAPDIAYVRASFNPKLPRNHDGPRTALSQAIQLQKLIFKDATNPKTDKMERAQLTQAWDRLEERKRILRMTPKPAAQRVAAKERPARRPTVQALVQPAIQDPGPPKAPDSANVVP